METSQSQYDGVGWVTDIVRHILNPAQLDQSSLRTQGTGINFMGILNSLPKMEKIKVLTGYGS